MRNGGQRAKGHAAENEVCKILSEKFGYKVKRNLDQVRNGGADIIDVPPFAVEVKRHQVLNIPAWWKQALSQTTDSNPIPVLLYRQNGKPWMCCIPFNTVSKKKYSKLRIKDTVYVTISLPLFLVIAGNIHESNLLKLQAKK